MIDWGKLGPGNSPVPDTTPDTTAPVAPEAPGSLTAMPKIPTIAAPVQTGNGYQPLTQAQVDSLDPGQRIGRGIDFLGQTLFGTPENRSPLGSVPFVADALGAVGNVGHGLGDALVVKPIEATAGVASRIPLGWLPGGADENFNQIGEWAKTNMPDLYAEWQKVQAAGEADKLMGGNLKADFNLEAMQMLDDMTYEGKLGTTPILAMGRAATGSLGGAFAHAVEGWLGLAGNTSQRLLGEAGVFDPQKETRYTRNRVEEAAARLDAGGEISDVEKQAVEAVRSGAWSMAHAQDFLVSHGQGITRNIVGQLLGSVVTDPLTYATIGAGSIAKAGKVGADIARAGGEATTAYQKAAVLVRDLQTIQTPIGKELGGAFRIARGLIDPLAVYRPNPVDRAVTDMMNGTAITGFYRGFGHVTVKDLRAGAREYGMGEAVDSAIASASIDQARLMIARNEARVALQEGLGVELMHTPIDPLVTKLAENAGRDAVTELTDHIQTIAKNTFTPEEDASLVGRLATSVGGDTATWTQRIGKMSNDLKAAWHLVTYKLAEKDFEQARALIDQAAYQGNLPLRNMVLMTRDTLDNVAAQGVLDSINATLKDTAGQSRIARATAEWNTEARRYPAMQNIGYATGGEEQVKALLNELEKKVKAGALSRRAEPGELADPALKPINDMLARHTMDTPDGPQQLWNVGFRPDEEVAWGLKRDPMTGRPMIDRDPTISHVVDAVPGRQQFSDTTRNVLGQIIGKSGAERLNKPIDSIEAYINTMRDGVTGARMVKNIELRFERSMFEAGLPKPIIKEIWGKARDVAGLDYTTVRGIRSGNLWQAVHDSIPRDLLLRDGTYLNEHIVMDHLLKAAEGDLRIMGVTSVLSQRMRNGLRAAGLDPVNWAGQMTVTMYNKLRYAQPMFLIQRITDAPYYSILHGVTPVGKGALSPANEATRVIEENLGRTSLAKDFSMDMPEYATRSNFTAGIKSAMQQAGLKDNRLQRILETPDTIIANNMTNMLTNRWGDIVRGALDNLATAAEKDPALKAEMLQAGETLTRSFDDWARVYSEQAGRVLNDNEVGLRYAQDMLNGWRRHVVNADGTLDFSRLIAEGERATGDSIADIRPINPDILAIEMGYPDAAALRKDVTGTIEKVKGEYLHVPGEHDLAWLEERLREDLGAHPDYVRRAKAYFGDTWQGYWDHLARPVDEGGLDISPHYAKEAQDLITIWARDRGMDPWEYLSGVMSTNIGAKDLDTAMGALMGFLKTGKTKAPLEEWTKLFRSTLDVSAQQTLLKEFESAVNVEDVLNAGMPTPAEWGVRTIKGAPGKADRTAGDLPKSFTLEPGYAHRIDVMDKMRGGWRTGEGVSLGAPDVTYIDGRPGLGVFRAKVADGTDLGPFTLKGKAMTQGNYRQTLRPIPPTDIEMLTDKGWVALGPDPMDAVMAKDFPEVVRQRLLTGVPHPNPEVEAYVQQFSKWVQDSIQGELGTRTRHDLRQLVVRATDAAKPGGGPQYASTGRIVKQDELNALRTRGQELLNVPAAKKPVNLQKNIDKVAGELHTRTALTEWGGATYSPRTGQFIEQTNQYMYHGTHITNSESIAKSGINRGEFADLATAKRNALGKSVIYRAKEFDIPSIEKAKGWVQVKGKGVPPESLQMSKDGGVTWEPVVAGTPMPDGPWVSGVGNTHSISIADAQDPAKFKAALNQFVADNADELQKPGMFVGTFRDETLGTVQFDVARATFTAADTEAVQVAAGRTGGAYNVATGNGLFAPQLEAIPTTLASPYNRSQALVTSLLRNKFQDAQQDVFRLAEMQTKRTVLERSMNHPLFGLYPASYMWGKVLPETVKFLARNPYAASYVIADVQRAIAIQREYDREMDAKVSTVDRSAGAFLLDYLTPGLPWSDHQARMSPLVRDLFNGKDLGKMWDDELQTVSPQRWVKQVVSTVNELPGAIDTLTGGQQPQGPDWQQSLQNITGAPAAGAPSNTPVEITGPTKAGALAPILADDLSRLQDILIQGGNPER